MVATAVVQEGNGAVVTWTTITVGRYMTKDQYTQSADYPIKIPTSDFKYSFWKHHCLYFTGTFGKINNIKVYSDGSIAWDLGTGGMVLIGQRDSGAHGCPVASYVQATGTEGDTGDYLKDATNGHTYYKGQTAAPADLTSFTSGAPCDIDNTDYTETPARANAMVTQVKVATDAVQGEKADETFTFRYDEQ